MTFNILHGESQLYLASKHDLDFSSFHKIGSLMGEHFPKLHETVSALSIETSGRLETLYTFIDDPNGPDIPDGKFSIELAYPVSKEVNYEGPYTYITKPAYRYIAKEHQYPPFPFPWEEIRDYADKNDLKRTLMERDYHLRLKCLGDDTNVMECRVEVT